jgi:hypothetical protein
MQYIIKTIVPLLFLLFTTGFKTPAIFEPPGDLAAEE